MDKPMSNFHFKFMSFGYKFRDFFLPPKNILKDVGIKRGFHVLDYGCGPGSYTIAAAELVGNSGRIYALDIHPLAIQSVQSIASKKQLTNVETICSNCKTGLQDNGVDACIRATIYPGDEVKVKLLANGTSIKTGLKNSSNSGDLIVYGVIAALAYIPQPSRMFICHRVIEKYVKDGVWFFRTMGDNNPEPDPWEVPPYWVLGVVVQITHRNLSRSEPLDYSSDLPDRPIENPGSAHLLALRDLAVGILVGLSIGFVAAKIARKPAWR